MLLTPTQKLVVTGLFRYVRNPMYIAALLIIVGEALLFQAIGLFIYFLFGFFSLVILFIVWQRDL